MLILTGCNQKTKRLWTKNPRSQTFSMKRDIFLPAFLSDFEICTCAWWAFCFSSLSFSFDKIFKGFRKPASLPIKDNKFLLLMSSAFYFIFPPKSAGCPHLKCDISHLAYMEGMAYGRSTVTSWPKFLASMGSYFLSYGAPRALLRRAELR